MQSAHQCFLRSDRHGSKIVSHRIFFHFVSQAWNRIDSVHRSTHSQSMNAFYSSCCEKWLRNWRRGNGAQRRPQARKPLSMVREFCWLKISIYCDAIRMLLHLSVMAEINLATNVVMSLAIVKIEFITVEFTESKKISVLSTDFLWMVLFSCIFFRFLFLYRWVG